METNANGKSKNLLPTNSEGKPDFDFMESFIKNKETLKIKKHQKYLRERIELLKDFKPIDPIGNKEWKEFFLHDIFNQIQRGKRLKKGNHKNGEIPYVSSTGLNNGIDGYIETNMMLEYFLTTNLAIVVVLVQLFIILTSL